MNQENPGQQKVLFVITKGTWGGAQRYVYDLARSLTSTEYQPVVALGAQGKLSQDLEKIQIRTIPISSLVRNILPTTDIIGFFEMLKCIATEKPTIVHLNSSKAGVLGALAAKFARVPRVIFTVHGWPFKERTNPITRGILYFFSWLTASLSDVVIVVSKIDADLAQKMPGIAQKLQYIPIGIDTTAYLPKDEALQQLWKLVSSEKVPLESTRILIIAELTANKGIEFALEAMIDLRREQTDNYVCIVMGEGELLNSLQSFAKIHRLEDKVIFVGFVQNASTFMNAFDVFLLPSVKEGMPYVLLEAGESGIPIVATDVVNPELQERYENITIVHAGNGFAIADALRKIKEKTALHPTLPSAPRFPLSGMVQQTLELYAKR